MARVDLPGAVTIELTPCSGDSGVTMEIIGNNVRNRFPLDVDWGEDLSTAVARAMHKWFHEQYHHGWWGKKGEQ